MNLFYTDNLFNNGDGCGKSSNYYDERFSSAFSWARVLKADFRGFTAARMKDPMVALGKLLDRAANSGVGAACH